MIPSKRPMTKSNLRQGSVLRNADPKYTDKVIPIVMAQIVIYSILLTRCRVSQTA